MASHAVARETVVALRQQIAKIEGRLAERLEVPGEEADGATLLRRGGVPANGVLPLGAADFDHALGGGIPLAGLTEVHAVAARDAASVAGFLIALTTLLTGSTKGLILWAATAELWRETGYPYVPGLSHRFGLAAERLLVAEAPKPADVLWIAEEAASTGCFAAILLEVGGDPRALDLTATRRLHRRALNAGHPVFLLRQAAHPQPTAAPLRLMIAAAASTPRHTLSGPLRGSIGPPAFNIGIGKSRSASQASITLEWTNGAFHERQYPPTALPGAVAPLSASGTDNAPAIRQILALTDFGGERAARLQPPREQHPARCRARRAG